MMLTQAQTNNENQNKGLLLTIVALITGEAIPIFALLIAATVTMMRKSENQME
jgi:ABC-type tungstate transport system substrate-binding protein